MLVKYMLDIVLLPLRASLSLTRCCQQLLRNILVVDTYITGAETWTSRPWGWETVSGDRRVTNVHHHADDARFHRNISNGNLAAELIRARGTADSVVVVMNHAERHCARKLVAAGRFNPIGESLPKP